MSALSDFIESSRRAQGLTPWPDPALATVALVGPAMRRAAADAIGLAYVADGYGPEPWGGDSTPNSEGAL